MPETPFTAVIAEVDVMENTQGMKVIIPPSMGRICPQTIQHKRRDLVSYEPNTLSGQRATTLV